MEQALIADAGHRAAGVAAQVLGPFHVARLYLGVQVFHELLGVNLRQRQVDNALNAERQAQDQGHRHQRHKERRTVDELLLQLLVERPSALLQPVQVGSLGLGHQRRVNHRRVGRQRVSLQRVGRQPRSLFGLVLLSGRHDIETQHQGDDHDESSYPYCQSFHVH